MTISLRLNKEDADLIQSYAKLQGVSVSELIRQSVFDRIEDELDLKAYGKALAEYQKNPVTYSLEEVEKELGI